MSKHTPGPWYADKLQDLNAFNVFQHGATYSLLTITPDGNSGRDVEPDARLIAAAPELLEALKETIATWDSGSQAFPIAMIRAAIAKAEGK